MQPPEDLKANQEPIHCAAGRAGSRLRWLLLSCATLSLIGLLVYPFPMDGRAWSALFDLVHAPTFFFTFLFIAALLDPSSIGLKVHAAPVVALNIRQIVLLAVVLCTGGLACEIAQEFVDRQSSMKDAAANSCGVVAAAFHCGLFRVTGAWRWFAFPPLIVVLLIMPGVQPLNELVECYRQAQEFPLLASFERPAELRAWQARGGSPKVDFTWATHGKYSIKLQAPHANHLSFAMYRPMKDWTGYSRLQFDVFNPTNTGLTLGVSVGDQVHQDSHSDPAERFSTSFIVGAKQAETITIELREIQKGPINRSLSMTEITMVNFFLLMPAEPSAFQLDNLRLIP